MDRRLVVLVLLLAFALRLAAGFVWQRHLPPGARFGFGDSEGYWLLAQHLVRGEPYQVNPDRRVFRTPGYPLVLAGWFCLVGDDPAVLWGRALSAALGTVAVGLVTDLTRRLFDARAGLLAGAVAAICPDAIGPSVFVLSEAPFCPLLVLQLWLWSVAWSASGRRLAVAAGASGVVAGLATLMRPSWLLFTPFALGVALVGGRERRRHAMLGVWMLAGLAIAMAPWWIRNWQVVGRFVPTTLQVGESLYDGWNPEATGASDMRFVDRFRDELKAEDMGAGRSAAERPCFEERLDRRMRNAAITWAQTNPGRVLELAGNKFLRMWNVWPNEPALRRAVIGAAILVGYVPVMALAVLGAWKFCRRGWPFVLCWLPAVYFTSVHVVFVGSLRYRQPAMLALIVLAAGAVERMLSAQHRNAKPHPRAG